MSELFLLETTVTSSSESSRLIGCARDDPGPVFATAGLDDDARGPADSRMRRSAARPELETRPGCALMPPPPLALALALGGAGGSSDGQP